MRPIWTYFLVSFLKFLHLLLLFFHRHPSALLTDGQSHTMVPNPVPLTPRFLHKEKEGVKFTTTRLIRKLLTFTKGVGRGGREEGSDKSLTKILSKPRLVNPLLLPMEERELAAASDCFALTRLGSRSQILRRICFSPSFQ